MSATGRWLSAVLLAIVCSGIARFFAGADGVDAQDRVAELAPQRFESLDVFVDAAQMELAAWQAEILTVGATAKIVGIEGGDHEAFGEPPFYDPSALQRGERVVLAAFRTVGPLPSGRVRVARVHYFVEEARSVSYQARLIVAGGREGSEIRASVHLSRMQETSQGEGGGR